MTHATSTFGCCMISYIKYIQGQKLRVWRNFTIIRDVLHTPPTKMNASMYLFPCTCLMSGNGPKCNYSGVLLIHLSMWLLLPKIDSLLLCYQHYSILHCRGRSWMFLMVRKRQVDETLWTTVQPCCKVSLFQFPPAFFSDSPVLVPVRTAVCVPLPIHYYYYYLVSS